MYVAKRPCLSLWKPSSVACASNLACTWALETPGRLAASIAACVPGSSRCSYSALATAATAACSADRRVVGPCAQLISCTATKRRYSRTAVKKRGRSEDRWSPAHVGPEAHQSARQGRRSLPVSSALIATCAALRPTTDLADPEQATRTALRRLARRHQYLSQEITDADSEPHTLITAAAPQLLELRGVGLEVAGQLLTTVGDNRNRLRSEAAFAHLCGVAPIPASSGRVHRHRLNRGGDRAANTALYIVVLGRLRHDPRTRAYVTRRTTEGLSKPEIIRCLKRYAAREIYHALKALPAAEDPGLTA